METVSQTTVSLNGIRLEAAENGLVLSWSEMHNASTHSNSSYKDKKKIYGNSNAQKLEAVNDMIELNNIQQDNPYDSDTFNSKMEKYHA